MAYDSGKWHRVDVYSPGREASSSITFGRTNSDYVWMRLPEPITDINGKSWISAREARMKANRSRTCRTCEEPVAITRG